MIQETKQNKYDLEERTAKFGVSVIELCKKIEQNAITKPIINQIIRSATSIGANYMEANGASSKKDFINKIFICKKEAQETKHWLRMLSSSIDGKNEEIRKIWQECQELTLIFQKIASSSRSSLKIV
jgi:four helix bundle protein